MRPSPVTSDRRVVEEEKRLGSLVPSGSGGPQPLSLWPATVEDVKPIREVRAGYARRALELSNGNYAATARTLGISVNTLRRCLRD